MSQCAVMAINRYMQITNSVVCDTSKGSLHVYKQIKPSLVDEHAFPLTGFVCESAYVTLVLIKVLPRKSVF